MIIQCKEFQVKCLFTAISTQLFIMLGKVISIQMIIQCKVFPAQALIYRNFNLNNCLLFLVK